MYLFSHIATSIEITILNIGQYNSFQPQNYHFRMVLKGTISVEENGEKYILEKDDIILLQPGIQYHLDRLSDHTVLDVAIPVNFFESFLLPGYRLSCNSAIGRKNDYLNLRSILTDMLITHQKEQKQLKMCSLLYALMDCVNENYLEALEKDTVTAHSRNYKERVAKIAAYLHANYPLPLNQQMLADHMFLTPQYLSKFIKQNFGMNFSKYLNQIRIEHALEELVQTDHSITSIAFNNGFASMTAFNKVFREQYNATPTAYRQGLNKTVPACNDSVNPLITKKSFDDIRSYLPSGEGVLGVPENTHRLSIDTTRKVMMCFPWLEILNVGLAQNILSHNFHQVFSECQEKFHFHYARFQNIFSEKIFFPIHSTASYDFTNYDDIIDFFHRSGIYPFIELGNKPEKIAYNAEKAGYQYAKNTNLADRTVALDALLKHSLNRYGLDYVSRWKFELWAEQDEYLEPAQTPEEYIHAYCAYSAVLKKYLPNTAIGGPGFNTSGNIENYISILNAMMRHHIIPGFISIYLYSYDSNSYDSNFNKYGNGQQDPTAYRILSTDPQRHRKVFSHIKGLARQILPEPVPIYVTEFNSSLSTESFIPNSAFQAAFVAKNALDLMQEADGLGYWLFTDISNEYLDARINNAAGIGLIDNYGIKKPSYYAYEFLSRLGTNLISHGLNHAVTSSDDNNYQILAYHYTHYNKYFCINCFDKIGFQNTYSVFEEAGKLHLEFDLENMTPGRYKIRKYILNRTNGSFLDEFLKILEDGNSTPEELLYMMLNLQKAEVEYYKSICIPRQDISYVNCDGNMSIPLVLDPHEVNYITIIRRL